MHVRRVGHGHPGDEAALVAGEVGPDEAAEQLRRIKRHPRNYSPWAVSLASSFLAAAVAVTLPIALAAKVDKPVVVGVVDDVRQRDLSGLPEPEVLLTFRQVENRPQ